MVKKAFIYAYTNMNLGDDLFIKILCDRYPKTKFYIVCNIKVMKGLRKISNLRIIPSIPIIDAILYKLAIKINVNEYLKIQISKTCDVIIHIGGSIFQQPENIDEEIILYKKRMVKGKPFFILGSNFGPFNKEKYYYSYKSIFNYATDICFRDKFSFDLFSNLPNVRYAPDIVFNYNNYNYNIKEKNQIIISAIDLTNRKNLKKYENIYIKFLIEISKEFIRRKYDVCFLAFCKNEGDYEIIKKIMMKMDYEDKHNIKYYIYNGDIKRTLKILQESKIVIATRFHAIILGWIFNKKVLPIIYNLKSENVINDMKIENRHVNIESISKVDVNQLIINLLNSDSINISSHKEYSKMQFKQLDKYLLEK